MYKSLVNIKNSLVNLIKIFESTPKSDAEQIEMLIKIMDIVELILYFNNEDQQWGSLKILTSSQMLSRLPTILAQLKSGNNWEKL